MFAIVSNLRFISTENFMLSWTEHEKQFITSGPDKYFSYFYKEAYVLGII